MVEPEFGIVRLLVARLKCISMLIGQHTISNLSRSLHKRREQPRNPLWYPYKTMGGTWWERSLGPLLRRCRVGWHLSIFIGCKLEKKVARVSRSVLLLQYQAIEESAKHYLASYPKRTRWDGDWSFVLISGAVVCGVPCTKLATNKTTTRAIIQVQRHRRYHL